MVAPSGPDDETWKSMSKMEKTIYWIVFALIFGTILYFFLTKLLR